MTKIVLSSSENLVSRCLRRLIRRLYIDVQNGNVQIIKYASYEECDVVTLVKWRGWFPR